MPFHPIATVSLERLYLFHCSCCGNDWSIADRDPAKQSQVFCPNCGWRDDLRSVVDHRLGEAGQKVNWGISYTVKPLYHFRCGECKAWWSDEKRPDIGSTKFCPDCGADNLVKAIDREE